MYVGHVFVMVQDMNIVVMMKKIFRVSGDEAMNTGRIRVQANFPH